MARTPGLFDVDERLQRLSDIGDQLEAFSTVVDFEMFRPELNAALGYGDGAKGGRPPFDPVVMFKILMIQAQNDLSDDRAEFLINNRLSFMRFLGLGLTEKVPDAKTIWAFRERLTRAGVIAALFARFDRAIRDAGYIPMSGQIVDASLVSGPRQRNTQSEKAEIKAGRVPQDWKDKPAKLRQKDRDARWTLVFGKARLREDGTKHADVAIPVFGYSERVKATGPREPANPRRHRPPARLHPQVGCHRRHQDRSARARPASPAHLRRRPGRRTMRRRKPNFEGVGSDRAIFVDAEGLNSTANWTLLRAEQDVALCDEVVTDLSGRFGFPVEDMRRLAIDLAIALDPEHTPANAPLDLPKAAERARKTGTAMHEQLGRAMDQIDVAHLGLDKLHADPLLHGAARRRLRQLHEKMTAAHEFLWELRTETRWIADNDDAVVVEATPSDQRKIADLRRQHVLKCIFAFWERSGRKLTVTTDAVTSERRGALVDFANAVVERVAKPSARLSGETIRKDLKRYRTTERP